ncbi:sulfurtransferase [Streptomyces palmae]|uniref:Sulfurtransferase n=1 Tax=Streptomyces palmae TaxID=1701085 RepID=A0A4Z0HEE0_9ACTN|nr:sulfurtransferase [Streptomyces palmae]TGB16893.1 sulfurtransferase [Streptomyces palmae]
MTVIITASQLADELAAELPPVVLDVRYRLGAPHGRPDYEGGHIPGAVFVDLEAELAGKPGPAGRHPLPELSVFTAAMRRAGITADREVVVYDAAQGWAAARAWWMLGWAGHRSVRVLDGGLAAWTAHGGPLSSEEPQVPAGDFTPAPGALRLLTADEAAELARRGVLLDARAAERYRGEVEPIDPVAGHIPGARSAPTTENLDADGRFLSVEKLAERFRGLGVTEGTEVGVYCGSGVSAAQQVLALAAVGIPAALYVGSWSEWSADPARPVATGPESV